MIHRSHRQTNFCHTFIQNFKLLWSNSKLSSRTNFCDWYYNISTYKALAAEGCNMKYSVAKQDTIYSIVATVRSDRMNFLTKPTMKIRTFTGKYLELRGTVIGNGSQSAGVISGNIVIPVTEISSTAQFRITPQQFEILNEGVAKIRLSMTPMNHERTFKKDKIGKKSFWPTPVVWIPPSSFPG